MSENEERSPKEILSEIQRALDGTTADERLAALASLNELTYSSAAILRQLDKIAVSDRSKAVREAAFKTLQLPLHRQIRARGTQLAQHTRRLIATEISSWEQDEILDETRAEVLRERYAFDFEPAPAKTTPAQPKADPDKPKRTLAQTLFSETSIKVSLYLGAFFIIAAAAIFAAIIEGLRLPILFFFTFAFGGGALVLKKKLPQPSFTLFIIFSVLMPIDASVIADQANILGSNAHLYWFVVYLLVTALWAFSTWFYRSRFFSVVALFALDLSIYNFISSFGSDVKLELYLLLFAFVSLVGLLAAELLKRWQDDEFARSLFWLIHVHELILLFVSFIAAIFRYDNPSFELGWWLAITATWWLGAVFYLVSNWLKENTLFRSLVVVTLMPLAWFFMNTFGVNESVQALSFLVWGALFALGGEALHALKGKFHQYGQLLIFGAVPLVALSVWLGIAHDETLGFALALSAALLYTLLSLYRVRLWTWAYALLAGLAAYFLFFELDFMRNRAFFYGFMLLIPSALLLLPDMLLKNDFKADLSWRLPPRLLGAAILIVNVLVILDPPNAELWKSALIYGVYALFGMGYALRYFPEYAYNANAALLMSIIYILRSADAKHWIAPLISLAVLFYIIGLGLERFARRRWARVYILSGLVLGSLVAISAPFEDLGAVKSIPVVIAAGLFTIEAFRKRNLWLGFPANALYLMAYFMLLLNFEVDQPQFYSVAAAAVGMLMHYLLVRAGSKTGAFITGMLSQLVLLTTTYIQLVSDGSIGYFVVLFFQALAVLIYGIVSRSRSLVITPIIFLVIGVLTVTINLVGEEWSIILIGCTGVILIAFAIAALLLRERFASLREQLDDWNA